MTPLETDPEKGLNGAVAGELRAIRARKRITYDALAARSEVNKRTIFRVLNGERAITTSVLEAICEALEVLPSEVLESAQQQLGEQAGVVELGFDRAGRLVDLPADLAAHRPGYDPDDEITD